MSKRTILSMSLAVVAGIGLAVLTSTSAFGDGRTPAGSTTT